MGIFSRKAKFKLPEISNEPGWEGSDEALLLAQQIVYETATKLEIPWFKEALKKYMIFLSEQRMKVSDEDFVFVQRQTTHLWDVFRNYMMLPEVGGRWSSEIRGDLFDLLTKEFTQVPHRYQPPTLEQFDLAQLSCLSLETCLLEDKQILANAIFEVIEVLWCHHLDGHPKRIA
jgi:hypothetical protein